MKKQYIIPIFVPHLGCPNDCVFCNQKSISGQKSNMTKEKAKKIIDDYLESIKDEVAEIEIAFFGGSFTAIEKEKQEELLKVAYEYIKNEKVESIRVSTRPDCIDKETLKRLKKYGVKTIELGVQSANDYILKKANRGHTFEDVKKASKMIRWNGFKLGHQMMVGLPESTRIDEINTAKALVKLKPKMVRIYPVLVIKNTKLEEEYKEGKYQPLSVVQAVEICKDIVRIFADKNIDIIRIGLQNTEEISDPKNEGSEVVAGPYHPAFRQLVESAMWYDAIVGKIKKLNTRKRNGEFMGSMIPYGYIRSSEDKHKLVIDDEAAKVVKKIFKNALKGLGTTAIARKLNKDGINTPSLHKINVLKIKCNYRNSGKNNYLNDSMVAHILRNRVYLGKMVQCKYKTVSYKIHKRVKNSKENWIIVKGTHEALVSKEDFKWIQEKYYTKIIQTRRKNHDYALFSGFLICNDCHRELYYLESRRPRKDGSRLKYYICGTNKVNSKGCTPHRIKEDDLIEIVRKSINKQIKLVTKLNDDLELISKNKKLSNNIWKKNN